MLIAARDWTPSLRDFEDFAELSGDANPIHVSPDYAARHPFGRPVSHGMLIHARLWAMGRPHLGVLRSASLRFPHPAYAEAPLHLSVTRDGALVLARACRADGTPVYEGEWHCEVPDADR